MREKIEKKDNQKKVVFLRPGAQPDQTKKCMQPQKQSKLYRELQINICQQRTKSK